MDDLGLPENWKLPVSVTCLFHLHPESPKNIGIAHGGCPSESFTHLYSSFSQQWGWLSHMIPYRIHHASVVRGANAPWKTMLNCSISHSFSTLKNIIFRNSMAAWDEYPSLSPGKIPGPSYSTKNWPCTSCSQASLWLVTLHTLPNSIRKSLCTTLAIRRAAELMRYHLDWL